MRPPMNPKARRMKDVDAIMTGSLVPTDDRRTWLPMVTLERRAARVYRAMKHVILIFTFFGNQSQPLCHY